MTGKLDGLDPALLVVLARMEQTVGRPLVVTSGKRPVMENDALVTAGLAKPDSSHLTGKGGDLSAKTSGERLSLVAAAILAGVTRIGVGKDFVHVDVDEGKPQHVLWLYPCPLKHLEPVGRPGA